MAGLESVENIFPINIWCQIVKQADITMNLLLRSGINPRLSAYAQIFGTFGFNTTPMAQPGTKIIAHEKQNQRATWSKHGV